MGNQEIIIKNLKHVLHIYIYIYIYVIKHFPCDPAMCHSYIINFTDVFSIQLFITIQIFTFRSGVYNFKSPLLACSLKPCIHTNIRHYKDKVYLLYTISKCKNKVFMQNEWVPIFSFT